MRVLNILFIETFYGGSHRAFADGLKLHSRHRIRLFTLPPRFWKWRMRGAALEVVRVFPEPAEFDLVCATSMISLADLKALWGAACPPLIAYFHENQLNYPLSPGESRDFHYGFTDITTGLAADRIVFNSSFHRRSFFNELPGFISRMPDTKPLWAIEKLREKSTVLYPGIDGSAAAHTTTLPPLIIWNHRWEHDKNPESFFNTLFALSDQGFQFRLAVAGEKFSRSPEVFAQARQRLEDKIEHFGYMENRETYFELLRRGDIVISTAFQENFGLSIVEATAAGCVPLLPDRLSYPEIIPEAYHSFCLYRDDGELEGRLAELLTRGVRVPAGLTEAIHAYAWPNLIQGYDGLFEDMTVEGLEPVQES